MNYSSARFKLFVFNNIPDQNYLSIPMARCVLIMLLSLLSLMFWIASIALCVSIGVYVGTQDSKYCKVGMLIVSLQQIHVQNVYVKSEWATKY